MAYKVSKEDRGSFTILHPDGTTFKVAKSGLDPVQLHKIALMPRVQYFAEGGEVTDDSENETEEATPENESSEREPAQAADDTEPEDSDGTDHETPEDDNSQDDQEGGTDRGPASALNDPNKEVYGPPEPVDPVWAKMQAQLNAANGKAGPAKNMDDAARILKELNRPKTVNKAASRPAPAGAVSGPPSPLVQSARTMNAMKGNQGSAQTFQDAQQIIGKMNYGLDPRNQGIFKESEIGPMAKALNTQADALSQAQVQSKQLADQQGKLYQQQADQLSKGLDAMENRRKQIETDLSNITNSIKNGSIDPNRVYKTMSTGNKISAGIGLLLSGIGSGLTGQPNMAMDVLQKQIDRDIDSQKADLGNNKTLLDANLARLRNLPEAENMTRLQYNAILQAQLGQASAKYAGGTANPNYKMALAQLQAQEADLKVKLLNQGLMSHLTGPGIEAGSVPSQNPQPGGVIQGNLSPALSTNPNVVTDPMTNTHYVAKTPEHAKKLGEQMMAYKGVDHLIGMINGEVAKNGTAYGGLGFQSSHFQRLKTMLGQLQLEYTKLHGQNQPSVQESHMFEDMMQGKGLFQMNPTEQLKVIRKLAEHHIEDAKQNAIPNYKPKLQDKKE